MQTIVVGGGLLGLATAQALIDRGEEVLVLEANEGVGAETSFANGGMLTPSLPEPWNAPGVLGHLVTSLIRPGAALKLKLSAIPSLLTWGIGFIRHSTWRRYLSATEDNYRLARYSLEKTREMSTRFNLEYDKSDRGTLCIYRDASSMKARTKLCSRLREIGLSAHSLNGTQVAEIEPTLVPIHEELVGGIWLPDDARGDAHKFCIALVAAIEAQGGVVQTGRPLDRLIVEKGRVVAVAVGEDLIETQRVVVAAGVDSPRLLASHDIRLPLQPAKGYSITIDGNGLGPLPDVSIGDDSTHTVVSTLGDRLRVAGTAEFAGYDKSLTPARIDALLRALGSILPEIAVRLRPDQARPWAGLRPMSNDGRPFIGGTPITGLYVNTGHGALGWTMAAGSGYLLADLALGLPPETDGTPFHPMR